MVVNEFPSVPHSPPQFNTSVQHKGHTFSAPEIPQLNNKALQFNRSLSSTHPSVQHKKPVSSTPNTSFQHRKPLSSTHPLIQRQKTLSSAHPSVPHQKSLNLTSKKQHENPSVQQNELRDVMNWGVCGTEGFGAEKEWPFNDQIIKLAALEVLQRLYGFPKVWRFSPIRKRLFQNILSWQLKIR